MSSWRGTDRHSHRTGPRTLCNACGLVYAKLLKKRNRDAARRAGAAGSSGQAEDTGLGSNGDEDEEGYAGQ
ncbi:hypothetical protein OF83DRAFT_1168307 [Amylostereum chailletii]|nr:hypothetical protein OF83DRAFT_1168307 [Amylostereum chailletii]